MRDEFRYQKKGGVQRVSRSLCPTSFLLKLFSPICSDGAAGYRGCFLSKEREGLEDQRFLMCHLFFM